MHGRIEWGPLQLQIHQMHRNFSPLTWKAIKPRQAGCLCASRDRRKPHALKKAMWLKFTNKSNASRIAKIHAILSTRLTGQTGLLDCESESCAGRGASVSAEWSVAGVGDSNVLCSPPLSHCTLSAAKSDTDSAASD